MKWVVHATGRAQRGAALVETAIVIMVFVVLLFGLLDFGRLIWAHHVTSRAASEGVRMAILHEPQDSEVTQYVRQVVIDGGITETPTINISARVPNQPVSVQVTVPFTFVIIPSLISDIVANDTISYTAVMQHER